MKKSILSCMCLLISYSVTSADIFGSGQNQFTIDFTNITGDASSVILEPSCLLLLSLGGIITIKRKK